MQSKSCFALHRPPSPWNQLRWHACRCGLTKRYESGSTFHRLNRYAVQNGMNSVPNTWTRTVLHLTSAEIPSNSVPNPERQEKMQVQNFWSKNGAGVTRPALKVSRPAPKVPRKVSVHVDSEALRINTLASASGSNQICAFLSCQLGSKIAHSAPGFVDAVMRCHVFADMESTSTRFRVHEIVLWYYYIRFRHLHWLR